MQILNKLINICMIEYIQSYWDKYSENIMHWGKIGALKVVMC